MYFKPINISFVIMLNKKTNSFLILQLIKQIFKRQIYYLIRNFLSFKIDLVSFFTKQSFGAFQNLLSVQLYFIFAFRFISLQHLHLLLSLVFGCGDIRLCGWRALSLIQFPILANSRLTVSQLFLCVILNNVSSQVDLRISLNLILALVQLVNLTGGQLLLFNRICITQLI